MRRFAVIGALLAAASCAGCDNHKGEHCAHTHVETTNILAGKVLVPIEENVCDQWVKDEVTR